MEIINDIALYIRNKKETNLITVFHKMLKLNDKQTQNDIITILKTIISIDVIKQNKVIYYYWLAISTEKNNLSYFYLNQAFLHILYKKNWYDPVLIETILFKKINIEKERNNIVIVKNLIKWGKDNNFINNDELITIEKKDKITGSNLNNLNLKEILDLEEKKDRVEITALGGGNEIGASCYLLKYKNEAIMLDCGARVDKKTPKEALPDFDLIKDNLWGVIISHAHFDHYGGLPYLIKKQKTNIYMNKATYDIISLMLNKTPWETDNQLLLNIEDINHVLGNTQIVAINNWWQLSPSIYARLIPCEHILGSCHIWLQIRDGNMVKNILYTGDYKKLNSEIKNVNWDLIITEGTYLTNKKYWEYQEEEIFLIYKDLLSNYNGNVLIPAFAIERSQRLLSGINQIKPDRYRIILDGLAQEITELYKKHRRYLGEYLPARDFFNQEEKADYIKINNNNIIIASSGMMLEGSMSYNWFKLFKKGMVILTGFIAPNSPANEILLNYLEGKYPEIELYYLPLSGHCQGSEIYDLDCKNKIIVHTNTDNKQVLCNKETKTVFI